MLWIFERKGIYKFRYLGYWFYIINEKIIKPSDKEKIVKRVTESSQQGKHRNDPLNDAALKVELVLHARKVLVKKYNLKPRQFVPTFFYEFPDSDFYITEPTEEEEPSLSDAQDITDKIGKYFPTDKELKEIFKENTVDEDTTLFSASMVVDQVFSSLLEKYLRISSPVYSGVELYKSLQPINIQKTRSRTIAHLTHSFPELKNHPKALETLKKFLMEDHEFFVPNISSAYEQMAIVIIATLVYKKPSISYIRFYFKPHDIAYSEQDGILTIGRKDLVHRFKLTKEEIQKIFLGRKNSPPAIERLRNKPFIMKSRSGELRSFLLFGYNRFSSEDLMFIEIKPHSIFYSFNPGIKDNLWKLRMISEKVNPKAQRAVLALHNKFSTLRDPLEFSFETLAGYAGLSSRKGRKKSIMKNQIIEYLDILREIGDIDHYELTEDKVKIYPS